MIIHGLRIARGCSSRCLTVMIMIIHLSMPVKTPQKVLSNKGFTIDTGHRVLR